MIEPTLNSTPSGTTPGTLLKTVRQEKGISVVDVAARLCLSAQFIEDIEHDDYSRMSARAYARGYIMSYAQLLGVPQSQILPTLNNVSMDFAPPKNTLKLDERSNPVYQPVESHRPHSNVLLWISIFVIIILIGLVVMWWKGPSAPSGKSAPEHPLWCRFSHNPLRRPLSLPRLHQRPHPHPHPHPLLHP